MANNNSSFDAWWNSYQTKRVVGAMYSIGAAVVIIGALFKILHLPMASVFLTVGMCTEAIIFALGTFDKPHEEFEWNKIFKFDEELNEKGTGPLGSGQVNSFGGSLAANGSSVNIGSALSQDELNKLTEGIKNLSATANQLSGLSSAVAASEGFVKNLEAASQVTGKFTSSQELLSNAAAKLVASYQSIGNDTDNVVRNSQAFGSKVEEINKNLSGINSIYEIQLKNIQTQSETISKQNDKLKGANSYFESLTDDLQKLNSATSSALSETEKYKTATRKTIQTGCRFEPGLRKHAECLELMFVFFYLS